MIRFRSRGEPGRAKAAFRDFKLQISNGRIIGNLKYVICNSSPSEDGHCLALEGSPLDRLHALTGRG
jgi:hypothetical protein